MIAKALANLRATPKETLGDAAAAFGLIAMLYLALSLPGAL